MRCNACWRELESRAISTTCGHLLCSEDANKILCGDSACPVCDQVLSKSLMRPVEINPGEEWINMSMAGISPQILMKSAFRSVMFYIGQKELEMQYKTNKMVGQYKQKCEGMQAKFTEKMEEVHAAYQKMAKKCQLMEKEIETLSKDKQELQDKYAEKSRQKRKLDEMYDQLRTEYESTKRSAIQPAKGIFGRNEPDSFSLKQQDGCNLIPDTPGRGEEAWAAPVRDNNDNSFNISIGSPVRKKPPEPVTRTRFMPGPGNNIPNPVGSGLRNPGFDRFESGLGNPGPGSFGSGSANPAATLRNLIFSPLHRPNQSRPRNNIFQL